MLVSRPVWRRRLRRSTRSRNAVVVFPFVPVTAATGSSALGSPKKGTAACGIAARTSGTTSCGRSTASGRSTTSATAPPSAAADAYECPSACAPADAEEERSRADGAGVVGEVADLHRRPGDLLRVDDLTRPERRDEALEGSSRIESSRRCDAPGRRRPATRRDGGRGAREPRRRESRSARGGRGWRCSRGRSRSGSSRSPAASERRINSSRSALPTPRPRAVSATYTELSATPAYTQRPDTGESAAQPITSPASTATSRKSAMCAASQASHDGTSVSKVAFPVAMPSA